jgi:hypothetical protein
MTQRNHDRMGCVERTNGSWRVSRTLLLMTFFLAGCGGNRGPERVLVSGTVTYKGAPVNEGRIRFIPAAASEVPMSGAYIVEGKYQVDGRGGIPVGTHKVQIEGYRWTGAATPKNPPQSAAPDAIQGSVGSQFLPPKYNTETQLEITIPPGSGKIVKNFDLAE